jgi:hypothetical protein
MTPRTLLLLVGGGGLYLLGGLAALLLGWHIVALGLFVTIGPGAPHLEFPIVGQLRVFAVATVWLGAALGASACIRRARQERRQWSTLLIQFGVVFFALAVSYRLMALVLCFVLLLCRLRRSMLRERLAWWICGLAVLSCLAPVDVSLRASSARSAPGLVLAGECSGSPAAGEAALAGRVVCLPDAPYLYSGPRYVWVW